MQMKSSYRLLNYALLLGVVASMASACVVTSGDGKVDGFGGDDDGGDNTAGTKTNTGGTSSGSAGKTSTGGTSAGTGGSATAGTGGTGGGSTFEAGVCDAAATSMDVPSCNAPAKPDDSKCKICLKANCCEEWQTCYGENPHTACGWGSTDVGDDRDTDYGQWDCIQQCYVAGVEKGRTDFDALQEDCTGSCLQQCDGVGDGFILMTTQLIQTCANDKCLDECFPTE